MLAGIRISLVTTISLATVTAWIKAGGLGLLLFDGIAQDNLSKIAAGAIAVIVLAIVIDQLVRAFERVAAAR